MIETHQKMCVLFILSLFWLSNQLFSYIFNVTLEDEEKGFFYSAFENQKVISIASCITFFSLTFHKKNLIT